MPDTVADPAGDTEMNIKRLWAAKSLQSAEEGKKRMKIPETQGETSNCCKKATDKMLKEKGLHTLQRSGKKAVIE